VGKKTVSKAERAWFLSRRERRAKPESELALPRWGKASVFLSPLVRAFTVFTTPSLHLVSKKLLLR
jgi:hypothetical protein